MKYLYFFLTLTLIFSCSKEDKEIEQGSSQDLINSIDLSGELNLFPLALNPEFTSVSEVSLPDNELVGIVHFGSSVYVYPYTFITHNEIINHEFQGQKYAFSYCPFTKSSIAFKRNQIFRASGYLYKDNQAPWDEETESIWSQMLIKGIIGKKESVFLNTIPVVETKWKTIKDHFSNARVITSKLFSSKNSPPEDDNKDNSNSENSPEDGNYVYGIIDNNNVSVFKYSDFSESKTISITFNSQKYIVYGNPEKRFINAFKVSNFDDYELIEDEFPRVLKYKNGTKYDVLGRGNNGTSLEKPKYAYVAIWRAWKNFYTSYNFQE